MSHLRTFSPEERIALANLMAFAFAEEFNADELNVLGNWVVAVGGIMLAIAAQQQLLDTKSLTVSELLQLQNVRPTLFRHH